MAEPTHQADSSQSQRHVTSGRHRHSEHASGWSAVNGVNTSITPAHTASDVEASFDGTIWTPDHRQCQTMGNCRRSTSAPPRIPGTTTDGAARDTSSRSQYHPQRRAPGNCICKQCTKCCALIQTAEVSFAVTMKLINMIDNQMQIMGKSPTKTSQHMIEVVTDSTIEPSPPIDVISTNYQRQQKYSSESSDSDASDFSSVSSHNSSIESPDGSHSAASSDTDESDDQ